MRGNKAENVFPGAVFGRLTVVERLPREKGKHRYIYRVLCKCECGGRSTPEISALTGGQATSCGCRKREVGAENSRAKVQPGKGYGRLIEGEVFGRLTVIRRIENQGGRAVAECRCCCGKIIQILADGMISGNTKSCGCLAKETTTKRNQKTAKYNSFSSKYPKTFTTWCGMISRCYRKSQKSYTDYGAKGVIVCQFLRESPENLVATIGKRGKIHNSLDRYPDHNGNYTCGQCEECKKNDWKLNIRWATRKDQSNNRGDFNVYLTAFGKTLTRSQWQDLSGINEWVIRKRIVELGWSVEKALTTPNKQGKCYRPN